MALDPTDLQRWNDGTFHDSYRKLGAHPNRQGTWFTVWAPHAETVSVVGDFNGWDPGAHPLQRTDAGLWQGYVRGARAGHRYKYRIKNGYYQADKSDPYAFAMEPPTGLATEGLASIITELDDYTWNDAEWMAQRKGPSGLHEPLSIYEVHLGSWMHKRPGESYGYREIAEPLAEHVLTMGFTHVEFLPLMEHPYYGSWGYQVIGYFAPTHRFGSPQDLMYLIDYLHQRGIGVLLDWVPGHFAADPQGLVYFDGSTLFEYDDPRMRYHPDWGTYVFDYNKPGVKNFLISNALFWFDKYHIDGLRVDAVASMLYRDYSRSDWTPNIFGGRENLEAIDVLKRTNELVFTHFPEALMIAEESTAWPGVSAPTYNHGLGFLYKWNMGWMHDTLEYMSKDPIHRRYHHNDLTFPLVYAFAEHYCLPLSHDEVVHGKGSLWGKMPGDDWQKAANLRLLYGHMFGHPGKKLLFMGSEFGQVAEWSHDHSIEWHLKDVPLHRELMQWLKDLNALYRTHPALWNDEPGGFEWIDYHDEAQSVISYIRQNGNERLIFVFNFTPVPRPNYRIGVPAEGTYRERLNSDATVYGGSGMGNYGAVESTPVSYHYRPASVVLTLPPLSVLVLERDEG
ncbi:MAG: 1,4-alpha-glucan branching protein GlgB [Bacteroidetes bacterium]|nr:glycogen-branching enzyme [Rhodothermaceae bacterium RA]RMH65125.1 MAG: 1,4-alpha-glucan branching protein GlgB [Bacteroidota bacterium]